MAELENRRYHTGEEESIDRNRTWSSPSEEEYRRRELARRRRARKAREMKRRRQVRRMKIATAFVVLFLIAGIVFVVTRHVKAGDGRAVETDASLQVQTESEETTPEVSKEDSQNASPEENSAAAVSTALEAAPVEEAVTVATSEAAQTEQSVENTTGNQPSEESQNDADAEKTAENEKIVFTADGDVPDFSEDVTSEYGILVNIDTMKIVAGRNFYDMMYPASMTKVLTVLVAAENVDWSKLDTDTFEMTQEILNVTYGAGASQVGWAVGDTPTVRDLFMGTILPSGGDAAMGLATYTAGSVDAFMEMMNQKLTDLGLADSAHFTNVTGLYDDDHYCTAYDMAVIMRAAIRNDLARKALSEHHYITTAVDSTENGYDISNWFLRRIEDRDTHGEVIAAKTGFVNESGNCAVSYQISNSGARYVCVTAGAQSSWGAIQDHVAIYDAYTE